ncbi:hypothetical protein [Alienimonas californiensis]|uniref:Uncharacterized protein n=1 Tax=Alienimonas californiensis TaxID=2527989 RepID=A0A517P6R7_9PLAN|nr:hypothetical protein [Alienimonas californiensis]QDT15053.1 hypothetical protein CA12_11330 [Alienimonas californiensis]
MSDAPTAADDPHAADDPLVWRDLPDPRGWDPHSTNYDRDATWDVEAQDDRWVKLTRRPNRHKSAHISDDSPERPRWDAWLGPEVVADLVRLAPKNSRSKLKKACAAAVAAADAAVRQTLGIPLAVLHGSKAVVRDGRKIESPRGRKMLLMVLENGARVVLQYLDAPRRGRLTTAFFPDASLDALLGGHLPGLEWQAAVSETVAAYCPPGQVLPDIHHTFEVKQTGRGRTERRTGVRFLTPGAWGFASDEPGAVWESPSAYPSPAAVEQRGATS